MNSRKRVVLERGIAFRVPSELYNSLKEKLLKYDISLVDFGYELINEALSSDDWFKEVYQVIKGVPYSGEK